MKRTRLSICTTKRRYPSRAEALAAAARADIVLHPYACDRGPHFHLTSRTRGKRIARPGASREPA